MQAHARRGQPVSQPAGQSVSQSAGQSVGQLVNGTTPCWHVCVVDCSHGPITHNETESNAWNNMCSITCSTCKRACPWVGVGVGVGVHVHVRVPRVNMLGQCHASKCVRSALPLVPVMPFQWCHMQRACVAVWSIVAWRCLLLHIASLYTSTPAGVATCQ